MAPMKQHRNNYSKSSSGEDVVRQADVLASCYIVDSSSASLKGLHYCTTFLTDWLTRWITNQELSGIPEVPSSGLPSPPSSPPLAAITATNQLALTPKAKSRTDSRSSSSSTGRSVNGSSNHNRDARPRRRGGATSRIREECERFFCETLRAMFLGERNAAPYGSILPDVYENTNYNYYHNNKEDDDSSSSYGSHNNNGLYRNGSNGGYARPLGAGSVAPNDRLTPPDDSFLDGPLSMPSKHAYGVGVVSAWLEIWDYAGGSSFRAFVSENEMTKTLFVFFDAGLLGRDLKKALVALIELAEGPLGCSHMVICVDRTMPEDEGKALMKGLQWAGFALTTLDYWTGGVDAVSSRWLFMGMEV